MNISINTDYEQLRNRESLYEKEVHKPFFVPLQIFLDYFFALHFHTLQ